MNKPAMHIIRRCCVAICLALVLPAAVAKEFIGLVYPEHDLTLSVGQGGIVSETRVRPGQSVKAGQVLLVLDDRMQRFEAERRKVMLDDRSELLATLDRARVLKGMYEDARRVYEQTGSVSRDEVSRLEVEHSAAKARLEQLEAQERREQVEYGSAMQELEMRRLKAPVAGVITRIDQKVGEWARPGDPMMALVDTSSCYLKVNVPLAYVQGLRTGTIVPIRVESADKSALHAKVSFISAVADPASGLIEIRLAFANPKRVVKPGVKGFVDLRAGDSAATH